jgi:hypothetical protein
MDRLADEHASLDLPQDVSEQRAGAPS